MTGSAERPRVLLLHGFLAGNDVWRAVADALAPDADTVAPDLPGYGASPLPPAGYSIDHVVDGIEPIVRLERPTHVVGHSMGAIVALALARRLHGAFRSIGVIGLPVFHDRADGRRHLRMRGRVVHALLQNDRVAHALCAGMRRSWPLWWPIAPLVVPGRPRHVVRRLFDHCGTSHAGSLDSVVFGGHVERLAHGIAEPVAVLHGERDRSAPLERVRDLGTRLGWNIQTVLGEDHQIPILRPALTAAWIRDRVLPGDRIATLGSAAGAAAGCT